MGLLSRFLKNRGIDSTDSSTLHIIPSSQEETSKVAESQAQTQRDLEKEVRTLGRQINWNRVNERERRANSNDYNLRTSDVADIHKTKKKGANKFGNECFTLLDNASQLPDGHPLREKTYDVVEEALVEEGIWTPGQYSAGVRLAVELKNNPVQLYRVSVELDDVNTLDEEKQRLVLEGNGILNGGVNPEVITMRNRFYTQLEDELFEAGAFGSTDAQRTIEQIARVWLTQRRNKDLFEFLQYAIQKGYGNIDTDRTPVGVLYGNLFWDNDLDAVFKDCLSKGWDKNCAEVRAIIMGAKDVESAEKGIIEHYDNVAGRAFNGFIRNSKDGILPYSPSFPRLARALDQATETTVRLEEMRKTYLPTVRKLRELGSTARVQQICNDLDVVRLD